MTKPAFESLADVIADEAFPDLDLALRRGRHVDRDDGPWYALLSDGQAHLEVFYRRYGCELVYKSDGYYYLLPTANRLGRRHLSPAEMLVGQGLTLLYLDPSTVQTGGVVTREQLLAQLANVLGPEALVRSLNPKRRRYDERVAEETVRQKVAEAIRRLAALGFVEALEDGQLRLRPALLRFAEPVRHATAPDAALTRLIAAGELVLTDPDAAEGDPDDDASSLDPSDNDEAAADDDGAAEEGAAGAAEDDAPPTERDEDEAAREWDALGRAITTEEPP
ncbi:MAG TPA: chromosome partition protein MukE [Polyangiaceae bacterium]|nr:chromosome partition protein MukE [Polyangiaceae bacterium]